MNSKVLASSASSELPRTSQELAKSIFKADLPEQYVRTIPAQSLYCVIQYNGLESSAELIEIITKDQCQLLLDLDLWKQDQLNEERVWRWLAITDATDSLDLLQKITACMDLKVITLLFSRYIKSETFDEPTDLPPGPNYHTPDKGSTWVAVEGLDDNKEFLLKRVLALIFESSPDLFYQLLAVPGINTDSMLEEEAFQDKQRRVQSEGIPDPELAFAAYAPYYFEQAKNELDQENTRPIIEDVHVVDPLIYDSALQDPLQRLLSAVPQRDICEGELSFLLNCSVIRWSVDFSDTQAVGNLINQVKGTLAIGIEIIEAQGFKDLRHVYQILGLQGIFRLAFTRLAHLNRRALRISEQQLKDLAIQDPNTFKVVACLREPYPGLPSSEEAETSTTPDMTPLQRLAELLTAEKTIEKLVG